LIVLSISDLSSSISRACFCKFIRSGAAR
jgi:hypothetical protein